MRLFVAVEVDGSVLAAAEQTANDLRRRLGSAVRPKWVAAANMHVTVRFIGHVAEERVPALFEAIRHPLEIAPFEVVLGGCGAFPPHGAPHAFWIGLREGVSSLRQMHDEFNRRLLPLGFEPETRPYSAHLTLARVKDAPRGSGAIAREAVRAVRPITARCRVSYATVFQSKLSPHGPKYERVLTVNLRTSDTL